MAELDYNTFREMYSYYDWFITGSNCIVYLASTVSNTQMGRQLSNVPVVAVGYTIQQQKSPSYGWNDTGPRIILNGQRIVTGELVILHRESGYLENILTSKDMPYGTLQRLNMNEQLRLQYWNSRFWETSMNDPQRASFADKRNLFYRHPNFDISIIYGAGDEVGRPAAAKGAKIDLRQIMSKQSSWYNDSTLSYKDVNPLYNSPASGIDKKRETIVGVQLNGKSKSISIDGQIVTEAYSFLAIDVLNQ